MEQAKNIKLVILDVDGVMSDGRIVIDDNGVEQRNFDIKDGFGVVALQMTGIVFLLVHFPYPLLGTNFVLDFHMVGTWFLYASLALKTTSPSVME